MNRTLNALFTQLKWQLQAVCNTLLAIEQHIETVEQNIHINQQKISNSCAIPALIMPEQEIARSHFMVVQQQNQHELTINKAALQSEQEALIKEKIRLNTALKMLEKHQEAMLKSQQQQTRIKEQNNSDEWVLQRRDSNEN